MKIVIISRGEVFASPTVLNYIQSYKSLGYSVYCICSSSKKEIQDENILVFQTGESMGRNPISKILSYWRFKKRAIRIIKENRFNSEAIFWIARIDTAIAFGNYFSSEKSILSLHELHDQFPLWKYFTKKVIDNYDQIVFNEYNRANIARVWYQLSETPNIIPNKPMYHERNRDLIISNLDIRNLIEKIKSDGRKIIIYQGSLLSDRNLEPLVKASSFLNENFQLVIMGKDTSNRISYLKEINPSLIHIPWVAPPDHLNITSHCHIGVAFYDFDSLNSIYCAPNKIWEYSGFSIPILGQNLPGLQTTIAHAEAGICVDLNETDQIVSAILKIDQDYIKYSRNSQKFYDSVDFRDQVQKVINKL